MPVALFNIIQFIHEPHLYSLPFLEIMIFLMGVTFSVGGVVYFGYLDLFRTVFYKSRQVSLE